MIPVVLGIDPGVHAGDHTAAFRHPDDGHSVAGPLELLPGEIAVGMDCRILPAEVRAAIVEKPGTIPPHRDPDGKLVFVAKSKDIDRCIAAANVLAFRLHALGIPVYMLSRQRVINTIKDKGEVPGNNDSWLIAKLNLIGALEAEPDCKGTLRVKRPEFMRNTHSRSAMACALIMPNGLEEYRWTP